MGSVSITNDGDNKKWAKQPHNNNDVICHHKIQLKHKDFIYKIVTVHIINGNQITNKNAKRDRSAIRTTR